MPKELQTKAPKVEKPDYSHLAITERRILELMERLKDNGTIRFRQELLDEVDIPKGNIYNIRHGKQRFSLDQIEAIIKKYRIDANWLFGIGKSPFRDVKK